MDKREEETPLNIINDGDRTAERANDKSQEETMEDQLNNQEGKEDFTDISKHKLNKDAEYYSDIPKNEERKHRNSSTSDAAATEQVINNAFAEDVRTIPVNEQTTPVSINTSTRKREKEESGEQHAENVTNAKTKLECNDSVSISENDIAQHDETKNETRASKRKRKKKLRNKTKRINKKLPDQHTLLEAALQSIEATSSEATDREDFQKDEGASLNNFIEESEEKEKNHEPNVTVIYQQNENEMKSNSSVFGEVHNVENVSNITVKENPTANGHNAREFECTDSAIPSNSDISEQDGSKNESGTGKQKQKKKSRTIVENIESDQHTLLETPLQSFKVIPIEATASEEKIDCYLPRSSPDKEFHDIEDTELNNLIKKDEKKEDKGETLHYENMTIIYQQNGNELEHNESVSDTSIDISQHAGSKNQSENSKRKRRKKSRKKVENVNKNESDQQTIPQTALKSFEVTASETIARQETDECLPQSTDYEDNDVKDSSRNNTIIEPKEEEEEEEECSDSDIHELEDGSETKSTEGSNTSSNNETYSTEHSESETSETNSFETTSKSGRDHYRTFQSNRNDMRDDWRESIFEKSKKKYETDDDISDDLLDKPFLKNGVYLSEEYLVPFADSDSLNEHAPYYSTDTMSKDLLLNMCENDPEKYVACTIKIQSAHRSICRPIDSCHYEEIEISGRSKCRQTFSDDKVVVEILSVAEDTINNENENKNVNFGRVIGVLEKVRFKDIDHPVFICVLDENEGHLMLPLCKTVPKLHILNSKVLKKRANMKKNTIEVYDYNEKSGCLEFDDFREINQGKRKEYQFLVCLICWGEKYMYPQGAVIGVLRSNVNSLEAGLKTLSLQHQIPTLYAQSTVIDALKTMKNYSEETDPMRRIDLSEAIRVFTIDPPGSKDLDDALSIQENDDGSFRVGVHIADVSSVLSKDSPVDREARERSFTFYSCAGQRNFHMLPEPLSQNLISLLQGKRRNALSLFFRIGSDGKLVGDETHLIQKTIIKSAQKFTYEQVQEFLLAGNSRGNPLIEDILKLFDLATKMRKLRLGDAMHFFPVEITTDETEESIMETKEAHYLVEEFMILANFAIAQFLVQHYEGRNIPLRCQQFPDEEKTKEWLQSHNYVADLIISLQNRRLLAEGRTLMIKNAPPVRWTQFVAIQKTVFDILRQNSQTNNLQACREIIGADELHPQQCVALRDWMSFQETAKYKCSTSTDTLRKNCFHVSLGICPYTHFTSPIRRYIDVVIHRLVHAALIDQQSPYTQPEIEEICNRANDMLQKSKAFQKEARLLALSHRLRHTPIRTSAFVNDLSREGVSVVIPGLRILKKKSLKMRFSLIDVCKMPKIEQDCSQAHIEKAQRSCVTVQWQKRLYMCHVKRQNTNTRSGNMRCHKINPNKNTVFVIPMDWESILRELTKPSAKNQLCSKINGIITTDDKTGFVILNSYIRSCKNTASDVSSEVSDGLILKHLCQFKMSLHYHQILNIQLTAETEKGTLVPRIQLFEMTNNVSFCLQHAEDPVKHLAAYVSERTKDRFKNVDLYLEIWLPIIEMESCSKIIRNEDSATVTNIPVTFYDRWGTFTLPAGFCEERDIEFGSYEENMFVEKPENEDTKEEKEDKHEFKKLASCNYLCIRYKHKVNPATTKVNKRNILCQDRTWVGHAKIIETRKTKVQPLNEDGTVNEKRKTYVKVDVRFKLHKISPSPPVKNQSEDCCLEFLFKASNERRAETILKQLRYKLATRLSKNIALGSGIQSIGDIHDSIVRRLPSDIDVGLPRNNEMQTSAIKMALRSSFSLIQGPPGTGKTYTGVKLICLFNMFNTELQQYEGGNKRQILYCGPSNKSVDLVARWMLHTIGDKAPRMIRVYGKTYERIDYPVPGRVNASERSTRDSKTDRDLIKNGMVLHEVIRQPGKPKAEKIKFYDDKFRLTPQFVTLNDLREYDALLNEATKEELKHYDVIFCTTSKAVSPAVLYVTQNRVYQCIIDESGMCTEPETMLPIIATRAQQVVLIGDHKQLQPIIQCRNAAELGLQRSLFERYAQSEHNPHFTMLEEQYRMNPRICDFPSNQFYGGKLRTRRSECWVLEEALPIWGNTDPVQHIPIAFVHVEGEEQTLTVTSEEGNEKSKSNAAEVQEVVRLFRYFMDTEKINPKYVRIITQYNAQRKLIKDTLQDNGFINIEVNTVVASQGGEWDYVIFSTVRSLPNFLIEQHPTIGWCRRHLGFITDYHQINVALTRAKKGLIIIGNKNLLRCDDVWRQLIESYEKLNRVFTPETFPPQRRKRRQKNTNKKS